MEKPAPTQHEVHELIKKRWSPRAFSDKQVDNQTLLSLLEAARWASSCYNDQPWFFMVATKDNPAEYQRMLGCLVEFNAAWAQHASVLMISVARLNFAHNNTPNRHALHDVGQAAANLALQASALGLEIHQMGGFSVEKTRETYQIPEGFEPVAAIAVGYPGSPDDLPEGLREKELAARSRGSLDSFVFSGKWQEVSSFVKE